MATEYITRDAAIRAVTLAPHPDKDEDGRPIANGKRYVTDCIHRIKEAPAEDVVPCARLRRYAAWFCASVSYPEFVEEAIRYCKDEQYTEAESRIREAACDVCRWPHDSKNEDDLMKHCECCPVEAALQEWPE